MIQRKGKYFSPSLLILSNTNCSEISYNSSTSACHALGIKKKLVLFRQFTFELKRRTIAPKSSKTRKFTNAKLVIEKSKHSNLIEKSKTIWNCSNGVYNIIFNKFKSFLVINNVKSSCNLAGNLTLYKKFLNN